MNYSNYNQIKTLQEKLNKTYVCKSGDAMTGNLNMTCNNILNVNNLTFCDPNNVNNNVMNFNNFTSNTQNTYLPSINNQPVSLSRISIFNNDVSYNIPSNGSVIMPFGTAIVNQLNLTLNGDIISPSLDISGQYVEIYANIEINTIANATDFSLDISGIDCNFFEIIDTRSVNDKNRSFYLTFGPHIFLPNEWANCSQFVFILVDNISNSFDVINTNKTIR
jgi:hypothetical protein